MKIPSAVTTVLAFLALSLAPRGGAAVKAQYAVLDNGLKIILFQDKQAPIVACRLFYVTGSVHEHPGNTGIAHMLEHMLFKGTKKVGVKDPDRDAVYLKQIDDVMAKLRVLSATDTSTSLELKKRYDSLIAEERKLLVKYELWEAYEKAGGTDLNAFTSDLMTAYFVTLPKNKLELYLWLESDRMQNAVLREFYSEHQVVQEERRMRVEDSPTGRYWESLLGVYYEAHPYRFPTIGYPSDIRFLTKEMAEEHYKKYYKPNNAIIVLAGDIDPKEAMEGIKRYFGSIPRGSDFPPIVTEEPQQVGEKRMIVRKNDAKPRLDVMFHTPGYPSDDLYALDIVEGVLSGKSGRLYKKLVKDLKIAISAGGGNEVDKYTSTFSIEVDLDGEPKLDKVEKAVWDVLYDLGQKPISDRELQRAKNQVAARTVRSLQDMGQLATELAYWEMRRSWEDINHFPDAVQQVTAAQVQAVCKKYFYRKNSTTGVILPDDEAKAAAPKPVAAKKAPGAASGATAPSAPAAQEGGAQ